MILEAKTMKKEYFDPKAEIVELSVKDIITGSEDIIDGGEEDVEDADGEIGL